MPRLTPEQRAELERQLAEDDADDGDDQVTIGHGDKTFTGTWRRAAEVAKAWGIKLAADPPAEPADKGDGKGKDGPVRFAGRRVS